ncbi:putative ribonuclease [Wickerhamomyces ciferrii]|uniref:Diphthine--ammonia ligase n=1 Tax=Wickerhamomyces ciferrii (strain ATCC 14091 / BCRC 22168 / CBS 111 / JCM 3599 / NBRC 0793 / NRRL Y-1031 F-60-10) TaxID=1206466 RepID=K0KJM7_WICCF|nr:putative ribonuclease [Wickerhamomyces ciferrii]CCH41684.1 putative ribonuclease [Wickerhamomyces ciferrii]
MKVVALVSGGKDSCFNILHCLSQGHELIALANLRPADHKVQELDSFMFQTVGHDALTLYSDIIGVPMYRGDIKGKSVNQQLDYKLTLEDEIEDLYCLLQKVQIEHPDVEAVSVGAILSSYQRTRVENVCQRLGLTSLAFLWQRDQLELMTEMVESSMDARIIKVAAVGLDESHLGKSLKEMFPILLKLNSRFEVHICGEGGEFETLVLDAPFFIKKLKLTSFEKIVSNDQVAYLNPVVEVVEKTEEDGEYHSVKEKGVNWSKFLPGNNKVLKESFQEIYDSLSTDLPNADEIKDDLKFINSPRQSIYKIDNKLFISNITSDKSTVDEQVTDVFQNLNNILNENNVNSSHIQHSTLLISNMNNFQQINNIYVQNFPNPLPPSRVCVETILPKGSYLQLSVIVLLDNSKKTGLHVQGRSYWAPANIGPYSQSIIDENLIATISGQIPLIPSTMELTKSDDLEQALLSLQHFDNVKQVIGCVNQLSMVSFVKSSNLVSSVSQIWENYCDENSEYSNPSNSLLIVQVKELPKSANVEWGGLVYKKLINLYEDDSDDEELDEINESLTKNLSIQDSLYYGNEQNFVSTLTLNSIDDLKFDKDLHYTIYTRPEYIFIVEDSNISVEFLPVINVWNYKGELNKFGIIIRGFN